MDKETILRAALSVVGKRGIHYGPVRENMGRHAILVGAYLTARAVDISIRPFNDLDMAAINLLGKLARSMHDPQHADNYVDMAGYAAIMGELANCDPIHVQAAE